MLLGITGTDGAGKGSVVDYLVRHHDFTHYSSRKIIRGYVPAGLEPTRNQLRLTANELRATHGDDFLVREALRRMSEDGVQDAAVESIRALAEAETLKAAGGILLAVDADQRVRFERVQGRRSETDQVTFEEFTAHEVLERDDPDPHGMQKAKVMALADHVIMNNGSHDQLYKAIDAFLKEIGYGR